MREHYPAAINVMEVLSNFLNHVNFVVERRRQSMPLECTKTPTFTRTQSNDDSLEEYKNKTHYAIC